MLLAGFIALAVAQQNTADLSEASLEQLADMKVYTASRHLQSTAEAPSAVSVVTADEIQRFGYRTLADVLQTVRGFFVTYDRNYSSVGVRGFARPGDYNTRILLLIDGHRLNDNIYDEAMIGTEFPLDIDLIQRIEIIRGPVSSLYGSNALFAVINIVTRKGKDLHGLEFAGDAGSFNTYAGRMSYGRKSRDLDFLLSGTFYGSRGHNDLFFPLFDAPATNYGIASHADDDQVGSALATITFHNFTLQGLYGTREKGIPTGAYGTLFDNPGTRTTDAHHYIDLRYGRTFAKSWDVMARGFYDRYMYEGTYIYSGPKPGQISPNYDYGDGKWWGTELQVSRTLLRRNRITAGGEYRNNIRQRQANYSLNPYVSFLDDVRSSFVGGAYVQDELTISKSLTLNAGLRYDYYSHTRASTDPRAALIYHPWKSSVFKLVYGQAFRVPNVYELYYSVPPNLPNPALKPEKIRDAELIWEQQIKSNFWFTMSGFYDRVNDLITAEIDGNDQIFRNLQNTKSKGVELEVRTHLLHQLEAGASYSFQQTRDRSTNELLSNSPRNLMKLNLSQPLLHKKLFASADAQYRSRIQSLDNGSVSPFWICNASLLGRNFGRHWDLSATAYNLLNKVYFDPASGENLQLPIQQDGRSFRVKLMWHPGEQ